MSSATFTARGHLAKNGYSLEGPTWQFIADDGTRYKFLIPDGEESAFDTTCQTLSSHVIELRATPVRAGASIHMDGATLVHVVAIHKA